jgi:hypothetical protein
MITDEERIAKITAMLKQNKLWVSQEGWDESDREDELVASINYLIQAYMCTAMYIMHHDFVGDEQ